MYWLRIVKQIFALVVDFKQKELIAGLVPCITISAAGDGVCLWGGGRGGGSPIYGPNRYVLRDMVLFLRFSSLNRVLYLPLLASCSRCDPQIGYLNLFSLNCSE